MYLVVEAEEPGVQGQPRLPEASLEALKNLLPWDFANFKVLTTIPAKHIFFFSQDVSWLVLCQLYTS